MLKRVIISGTGKRADIGKPMGGKTGTTNESKDAWFIGYTPDIVTGVFAGNDDNSSIGLTGGSLPAKIWHDMMIVATKKYGKSEFDYPDYDFAQTSSSSYSYDGDDESAVASKASASETKTDDEAKSEKSDEINSEVKETVPKPVKHSEETSSAAKPSSAFSEIPVQANTLPFDPTPHMKKHSVVPKPEAPVSNDEQ